MSNPPHRDFPIEWRTETGEFISQPAAGTTPGAAPTAGPETWGQPTGAGPPTWGQAPPGQHLGQPPVPPVPPQSPEEPLSAEDLLGVRVVSPDEHRAAVRLRVVALVLLLAALSVAWATGGLDKLPGYLPDDGIRTVAVGEEVDTGPFRITVERAAVFTEYGDVSAYEDGGTILIVTATIENLSDRTASILDSSFEPAAITLDGVRGLRQDTTIQIVSMRDGSTTHYLQPGLPERVGYVWEFSAGAEPPQEIGVLLYGATWRKTSFIHLNEAPTWWDHGPRARTTVTVEDRRGGS